MAPLRCACGRGHRDERQRTVGTTSAVPNWRGVRDSANHTINNPRNRRPDDAENKKTRRRNPGTGLGQFGSARTGWDGDRRDDRLCGKVVCGRCCTWMRTRDAVTRCRRQIGAREKHRGGRDAGCGEGTAV